MSWPKLDFYGVELDDYSLQVSPTIVTPKFAMIEKSLFKLGLNNSFYNVAFTFGHKQCLLSNIQNCWPKVEWETIFYYATFVFRFKQCS